MRGSVYRRHPRRPPWPERMTIEKVDEDRRVRSHGACGPKDGTPGSPGGDAFRKRGRCQRRRRRGPAPWAWATAIGVAVGRGLVVAGLAPRGPVTAAQALGL